MWVVKQAYAEARAEKIFKQAEEASKRKYNEDLIQLNLAQSVYMVLRALRNARGHDYVMLSLTEFDILNFPREDLGKKYRPVGANFSD